MHKIVYPFQARMSFLSRTTTYRAAKRQAQLLFEECAGEFERQSNSGVSSFQTVFGDSTSREDGTGNNGSTSAASTWGEEDNTSYLQSSECEDEMEKFFDVQRDSDSSDAESTAAYNDSDFSHREDSKQESNSETLHSAMANWALKYNVSHAALLALLALLSTYTSLDLPKHPRTLLQTPPTTRIESMSGGEYHYFGLVTSIKSALNMLPQFPAAPCLSYSSISMGCLCLKVPEKLCGQFLVELQMSLLEYSQLPCFVAMKSQISVPIWQTFSLISKNC